MDQSIKRYQEYKHCLKCGNREINIFWHNNSEHIGFPCFQHDFKKRKKQEHLCCKCSECGFAFMTSCNPNPDLVRD